MSSCSSDTISILPKIRVTLILIRVVNLCPLFSYSRKFLVTPLWVGVTTALDWGLLEPILLGYMFIFMLLFLHGKRAGSWHAYALWLQAT